MYEIKDSANDFRNSKTKGFGEDAQLNPTKVVRGLADYASIFAGTGLAFSGARGFGRKGIMIVGAGLMILGGRMLYKALSTNEISSEES